jgi:carboxyl-terminal processing protease
MSDPTSSPSGGHGAEPPGDRRGPSPTLVGVLLLAVSGVALFAAGLSLGSQGAGRDAGERAAVEAFAETYRGITHEYVGEWDADELLQGAIEGMLGTLDDPYTDYLGPEEFDPTLADISGEFEGIGARMALEDPVGVPCEVIGRTCQLRVVEVLADSPALGAGLLADDVVVAVDGEPLAGHSIDAAVAMVRGPRESEVTLTLQRAGDELQLPIKRGLVISHDVRAATLADGQVGYLRIEGFSGRAGEDFEAALKEHLDAGVERIVLDLRDDPGGFVDAAVTIASQFLPDGPVYWEEDRAGRQVSIDAASGGLATDPRIEVAVLVDEGSASASEIVAGALQDAGRAELIGVPTFGKGTVQEWSRLPAESGGLRLSVAKWLTRDKHWVNGEGLQPDVVVPDAGTPFWPEVEGAEADAADVEADRQLAAAVDHLLGIHPAGSDAAAAAGSAASGPEAMASTAPAA